MADQSNIQSAASKSIRPFRSSEEYLYAMKEDLAEWLNTLYDLDVQVDNFMDVLETGFDLCQHANNVNRIAMEFLQSRPEAASASAASSSSMRIPRKEVVFQSKNVVPGSFVARDNVSNFIQWCRQELGIQDVLMFETNDLVLKKNEKNFVLCLLEVARKGSKFGMLAPILIQMEEEIEEEMRDQGAGYGGGGAFEEAAEAVEGKARRDLGPQSPVYPNRTQRMTLCDLKNLDELVREILGHCTCPSQFPMVKVSEGKYKVGDSNALIFVRVLRSHVMVRVGGGWDTLEHYLDKHDPCRCTSFSHRLTQTRGLGFSPQKTSAPGSQPSSPNTQRRSEASGHPRVGEKRLSAGGEAGHPKGPRPGYPAKGPRDSTPPRQIAAHDGVSNRSGPSGQGSSASPLRGSQVHRDAGDPRAPNNLSSLRPRRLSGDSDSSGSSLQSGTLGRRRNEEAASSQRPGRRVSEGAILNARPGPKKQLDSRSQSRERAALPTRPSPGTRRRDPEERGRARMANGTGKLTAAQSPHPRARSQGRPSGEPVLLISRGKDGQHSWTRAEEPKETAGGSGRSTPRAKSPSARAHFPAGSRSPSLTNRRGSLPATKTADPSSIRVHTSTTPRQRQSAATGFREGSRETGESCASDSLGQELEQLARSFRTPLRLDPSQEQQLYRRLEEEFLANSQMMGLEEEEEEEPAESLGRLCDGPRALQTAPDPGAADSAYCSSSSSSSSLNFFTKYGLPPDPKEESKRNAVAQRLWGSETGPAHPNGSADPADFWDRTTRWRKPALSSSSDESNFPEVQERAVMAEPPGDALWGDGRPSASDGDPRSRTIDGDDALGHSPDEEVVLRPKSSLKKPDRVPSIYKLKLRPQIKPRTDSQPDKTPSKIPTPLSYKTAAGSGRPATGGSSPNPPRRPSSDHRPWTSFQNVFSSFAEPSRGPADSGVADEGSWA